MKPIRYIVVVHTDRTDSGLCVESFIYHENAKVYYEQIGTANIDRKAMYDAHNGMKVLYSYDSTKRGRNAEGNVSIEGGKCTVC